MTISKSSLFIQQLLVSILSYFSVAKQKVSNYLVLQFTKIHLLSIHCLVFLKVPEGEHNSSVCLKKNDSGS